KLLASGVTCSAARVRSPSFSRSSSSTTTTMRPARISETAPGTSVNGDCRDVSFWGIGSSYCRPEKLQQQKGVAGSAYGIKFGFVVENKSAAQRRRFWTCNRRGPYNVDSISNPQASKRASGIYLEFLFRRAHSRRRVERIY